MPPSSQEAKDPISQFQFNWKLCSGDARRPLEVRKRRRPKKLTLEQVESVKHCRTQTEAAEKLDICLSSFKRQLSDLKVKWPTLTERRKIRKERKIKNRFGKVIETFPPVDVSEHQQQFQLDMSFEKMNALFPIQKDSHDHYLESLKETNSVVFATHASQSTTPYSTAFSPSNSHVIRHGSEQMISPSSGQLVHQSQTLGIPNSIERDRTSPMAHSTMPPHGRIVNPVVYHQPHSLSYSRNSRSLPRSYGTAVSIPTSSNNDSSSHVKSLKGSSTSSSSRGPSDRSKGSNFLPPMSGYQTNTLKPSSSNSTTTRLRDYVPDPYMKHSSPSTSRGPFQKSGFDSSSSSSGYSNHYTRSPYPMSTYHTTAYSGNQQGFSHNGQSITYSHDPYHPSMKRSPSSNSSYYSHDNFHGSSSNSYVKQKSSEVTSNEPSHEVYSKQMNYSQYNKPHSSGSVYFQPQDSYSKKGNLDTEMQDKSHMKISPFANPRNHAPFSSFK